MPIEIRKLQIKAAISPRETATENTPLNAGDLEGMKQELIREVTEEVFKLIQLKLER